MSPPLAEQLPLLDNNSNNKLFQQELISCLISYLFNGSYNAGVTDGSYLNNTSTNLFLKVLSELPLDPKCASVQIDNELYKASAQVALSLLDKLAYQSQGSPSYSRAIDEVKIIIIRKLKQRAANEPQHQSFQNWQQKKRATKQELFKTNAILTAYCAFIVPLSIINAALYILFGCSSSDCASNNKQTEVANATRETKTSKQHTIACPFTSISNLWNRRDYLKKEPLRFHQTCKDDRISLTT